MEPIILNGRRVHNLNSFEVEEIAKLILEEKLDRDYFVQKTRAFYPDILISDPLVQKIDFAFNRITKPLSIEEKITFIIIPFGIVHRLYKNELFDSYEEQQMGFKKRINDYYLFSLIGLVMYLAIGISISYFF
ncbi:hypothetical protein FVB32_16375 [Flagellimonas hymeniacidonis]|uniref:Uncharacterized protein n=1 Tax=Flagellimonas hymeniacidonis TaxID=2603628 RepID=A0A5C8V2Z0_9FLAO|nr:hypothetical protein [Flagellimonas hymeniacidonis]TXN36133.1 hypothetical protein FVB32_16375 [Flagellimonas hymeniacidonis]